MVHQSATFPHATQLISFMKYISRNICFLFHSVHCSIEILYWFVASNRYFIFHATCFKQFISLVCAAPNKLINSVARLAAFSANLWILKIFSTCLRIFSDFAFLRIFDNFERIFLDIFVKLSPHARVARRQTNSATFWKECKNFGKYLHTY